MSCISEILKFKGDKPILSIPTNDEAVIEGGGVYKGYEYLITFTARGHRCGYVAIDSTHPLYGKSLSWPTDESLDVHGGITFQKTTHSAKEMLTHPCNDEWLGFDAMHHADKPCEDTVKLYFGEEAYLKWQKDFYFTCPVFDISEHRTFEYMEKECFKLIKQLIKKVA